MILLKHLLRCLLSLTKSTLLLSLPLDQFSSEISFEIYRIVRLVSVPLQARQGCSSLLQISQPNTVTAAVAVHLISDSSIQHKPILKYYHKTVPVTAARSDTSAVSKAGIVQYS